ncbi:MAG: BREX-1 system adenine-specific DNA-methyltransferase PglX, partial [Candidatus Muirbacterium halophilum]|nr:BREX-1 system adenine-specific DNA-methyltransferase PglX [Candidatus Muirbacterium halophilum]
MDTQKLKQFAQYARRYLLEQVETKLNFVLSPGHISHREKPESVKKLNEAIENTSKEQLIEKVAYIWFNRFCALRYMDIKNLNKI